MLATPTKLSTVNGAVYTGELPIPILSTVYHSDDGYHWFEFTPFEAGTGRSPCASCQRHCTVPAQTLNGAACAGCDG